MIHTVIKFGTLAIMVFLAIFLAADLIIRFRAWRRRRHEGVPPAMFGAPVLEAEPYAAETRYLAEYTGPDADWTQEITPGEEEWPPYEDEPEPLPAEHPQVVPWSLPGADVYGDVTEQMDLAWAEGEGPFEPHWPPCPDCGGNHPGICRPHTMVSVIDTGQYPAGAAALPATAVTGFTRQVLDPVFEAMWSDAPIGRKVLNNYPDAVGAQLCGPSAPVRAELGLAVNGSDQGPATLEGQIVPPGSLLPGPYDEGVLDYYDQAAHDHEVWLSRQLTAASVSSRQELGARALLAAHAMA
jgi:hypothetical protein